MQQEKDLVDRFRTAQARLGLANAKLAQQDPEPIDERSDERKLHDLETRCNKLLAENNQLKHNQAMCDANVQNFVREMNQLLD